MSEQLRVFLLLVPIVLVSLTLHELAHGWVAYLLGDPTAKILGRLSLNPIVHLDPLGSAMFVISYWGPGWLFGWAKPVPVNPAAFEPHPQRGMAVVALAGPATNFALALGLGGILAHGTYSATATQVLVYAFQTNIVLGVFNLLPIPPLDGSRIVAGFMSRETYMSWAQLDQYGPLFLVGILVLFQSQTTILLRGGYEHVARIISDIVGGTPLV
jgi:Zn-dependent protease